MKCIHTKYMLTPNAVKVTYLLGEPTEKLIQELREDEAYILERFKRREKITNGESDKLLTSTHEEI